MVDQGKDFTGTGKDQRGIAIFDRPGIANAADGRDIGAVELQAAARGHVALAGPRQRGRHRHDHRPDFTGATASSSASTDATSFTVDSDTQITATAPAGGGRST